MQFLRQGVHIEVVVWTHIFYLYFGLFYISLRSLIFAIWCLGSKRIHPLDRCSCWLGSVLQLLVSIIELAASQCHFIIFSAALLAPEPHGQTWRRVHGPNFQIALKLHHGYASSYWLILPVSIPDSEY